MRPFSGTCMMLIAWMVCNFARRHREPETTWYYVDNPDQRSGLPVVALPTIPDTVVTAEDFLHWQGVRRD